MFIGGVLCGAACGAAGTLPIFHTARKKDREDVLLMYDEWGTTVVCTLGHDTKRTTQNRPSPLRYDLPAACTHRLGETRTDTASGRRGPGPRASKPPNDRARVRSTHARHRLGKTRTDTASGRRGPGPRASKPPNADPLPTQTLSTPAPCTDHSLRAINERGLALGLIRRGLLALRGVLALRGLLALLALPALPALLLPAA